MSLSFSEIPFHVSAFLATVSQEDDIHSSSCPSGFPLTTTSVYESAMVFLDALRGTTGLPAYRRLRRSFASHAEFIRADDFLPGVWVIVCHRSDLFEPFFDILRESDAIFSSVAHVAAAIQLLDLPASKYAIYRTSSFPDSADVQFILEHRYFP
jgi:hypothetical protein